MTKEQRRVQQLMLRRNAIYETEQQIDAVKTLERSRSNRNLYLDLKDSLEELVLVQTAQKRVHRTAINQRRSTPANLAKQEYRQKLSDARLQEYLKTEEALKNEFVKHHFTLSHIEVDESQDTVNVSRG